MDKNQKMNSDEHIVFLAPGFPKDENDFNCIPPLQEFLTKLISEYLSAKISVIAFQYPYHNKNYTWKGINVIPLGGKNGIFKKPFVWSKAFREVVRINNSIPVNVVHSIWLGECALIGNILSKKIGCQHICTLMGQDVKASNKYLKWLKNGDTKFIALSKNQAEQFFKLTNKKVYKTIHWGIDSQQISNQERDIDLLGVGSLIPLKNYSLFVKTVEEIVKLIPNLKCKLAGTGPELTKLKTMTEEKGLTNNIEFTGLIDRKEIFKLMQRSKVLVHPSKFEGSGYVFAEALVNGMNIVSFNVGYAQKHPKWFIAKDDNDFINITKKLVSDELNFDSVNLFPLQETLNNYSSLYGISAT